MKKILWIAIALVLVLSFATPAAAQGIKIIVDGEYLQPDVAPFSQGSRTMVPVRFIAEALGGYIEYFPDDYDFPMVYLQAYEEDLGIMLFIDKKIALISEATYKTDVAPTVINGRTFLPIRFVADYLNFNVDWDPETFTVIITDNGVYEDETSRMSKYYDDAAGERLDKWLMDETGKIPFSYVVDVD